MRYISLQEFLKLHPSLSFKLLAERAGMRPKLLKNYFLAKPAGPITLRRIQRAVNSFGGPYSEIKFTADKMEFCDFRPLNKKERQQIYDFITKAQKQRAKEKSNDKKTSTIWT